MEVHAAIERDEITSVKFAWVKVVVSWSKGGPNIYAAIDITKHGEWPKYVEVCEYEVTKQVTTKNIIIMHDGTSKLSQCT